MRMSVDLSGGGANGSSQKILRRVNTEKTKKP